MSSGQVVTGEVTGQSVRRLGTWCLWAGILGAASGIFLTVVQPSVDEEMYSFPLTATGFTVIQAWFFVQHLGLILGLLGLWRSGAAGTSRLGRWGVVSSVAGMLMLSVTELVAISAAQDPYPSSRTDLLDVLYGISTIVVGVGLILAGVAITRAGKWSGWMRWLPLVTGIYVFAPMTPAIMGPFVIARIAITVWMLMFAALGWALLKAADH